MRHIVLIIIMLLTPVISITEAAENSFLKAKAPEFTLQDQYDRTVTLRGLEGRVVVLLASDKEGSAQNPAWQKAVLDRYKDNIVVLGIADLRSVPFFLKGKIKNDFKKQEGRIFLDWKGEVFTSYGLSEKVSNVILIDKQGYPRFMYAGAATQEAIDRLLAVIDRLR
jgi:predicted transcriptional regulator